MRSKRVLVVEDDAVSARMMRDCLEAYGYSPIVASNGVEGLARFHAEQPDMMIVDVALPLKNGFELCFDVKRTEYGKRMPLLLMSAVYTDHATRYSRDDLHAQGWLSKPFDLRTLMDRVQELIGAS